MSIVYFYFFFFKQKTAYEMRISDWSSDVCSSDLVQVVFTERKSDRGERVMGWERNTLHSFELGGRANAYLREENHPRLGLDFLLHHFRHPEDRKSVV